MKKGQSEDWPAGETKIFDFFAKFFRFRQFWRGAFYMPIVLCTNKCKLTPPIFSNNYYEVIHMLLREILQRKDSLLYSKFINIESKARSLLEYSQGGAHLQYTPHGLSHITAVESNYDWLLSNDDAESFNCTEIFILLVATYFHDAMMIPQHLGDENEARRNHASRAVTFLTKHYSELGLLLNESVAIGEVIKGHSVNNLDELQQTMVLGTSMVEIRKLAACLSLSDICHADESRAPWIVRAHLELDEESDYHWSRHLQISGITRDNNDLIMSAIAFSNDGENAITEYKAMVEEQLRICRPYFHTQLKPLNSVILSITRLASPFEQSFAFNTNMPEILNLLIEGVYSQKDVFVRELVQNSLDACMINLAKSRKANIQYHPDVVLTLYSKGNQIRAFRIDDNGIGMSIKDVKDTLLWIGSSIGKKKNVSSLVEETLGKQLIATFGIGLLSCFRVASRIFVSSYKENETPVQFSIEDISDTITPQQSDDYSVGSTFYVEFDASKYCVSTEEMLETFLFYFRDVNQAELKYMELSFDESTLTKSRQEIFTMARSESSEIPSKTLDEDDILFQKTITGENYSGIFWIKNSEKFDQIAKKGKIQILSEGIFVKEDTIDKWLPKHMSVFNGRLNISAKVLDLTASRDSIRENEKSEALRANLHLKSSGLFESLVRTQTHENKAGKTLSLLIMDILKRTPKEDKGNLIRKLDSYRVRISGSNKSTALKDLKGTVYVEYPIGHFVEELTTFEGKTLYHKASEFTQLQTSLMLQRGEVVLSAINFDSRSSISSDSLREIDLITQYCELKRIKVIDLVQENVVEGMCRSKKISNESRELVGSQIKFVDISGLPNKKTWVVGEEIWVNISNHFMRDIYNTLCDPQTDMSKKVIAKAIIDCLSYKFDDTVLTLYNTINGVD